MLRHRGLAPLFCGEPAELVARPAQNPVLEVVSRAGAGSRVHARLEFDPAPDTGTTPYRPS
jgi:3-methylfumaryl-CoA hydratase